MILSCGYACRIYLISIYIFIQAIIHIIILFWCYHMYWCSALPKPTSPVLMFTYMAYFYRGECMNLSSIEEALGFEIKEEPTEPPVTTSPTSKGIIGNIRDKASNVMGGLSYLVGTKTDENATAFNVSEFESLDYEEVRYIPGWTVPLHVVPYKRFAQVKDFPWRGLGGTAYEGEILWPVEARAVDFSYKWVVAYLISDFLWILATILLCIAAGIKVRGLNSMFYYIPWIIVVVSVLVMDLLATIYYSVTLAQTMKWPDFLNFVGVINMNEIQNKKRFVFPDYHNGYTYPAIFAIMLTSRVVVFWMVNLWYLLNIIYIFRRVVRQKKITKRVIRKPAPQYLRPRYIIPRIGPNQVHFKRKIPYPVQFRIAPPLRTPRYKFRGHF